MIITVKSERNIEKRDDHNTAMGADERRKETTTEKIIEMITEENIVNTTETTIEKITVTTEAIIETIIEEEFRKGIPLNTKDVIIEAIQMEGRNQESELTLEMEIIMNHDAADHDKEINFNPISFTRFEKKKVIIQKD